MGETSSPTVRKSDDRCLLGRVKLTLLTWSILFVYAIKSVKKILIRICVELVRQS